MQFLFAPDADAQVRRLTNSLFGLHRDDAGIYLVELKTGRRVEIMLPVPAEFDFTKVDSLSNREKQLFESLGAGRSMKQIAKDLAISIKTVETYRARLKQKLDLGDGFHVVRMAKQWKLLERIDDEA